MKRSRVTLIVAMAALVALAWCAGFSRGFISGKQQGIETGRAEGRSYAVQTFGLDTLQFFIRHSGRDSSTGPLYSLDFGIRAADGDSGYPGKPGCDTESNRQRVFWLGNRGQTAELDPNEPCPGELSKPYRYGTLGGDPDPYGTITLVSKDSAESKAPKLNLKATNAWTEEPPDTHATIAVSAGWVPIRCTVIREIDSLKCPYCGSSVVRRATTFGEEQTYRIDCQACGETLTSEGAVWDSVVRQFRYRYGKKL